MGFGEFVDEEGVDGCCVWGGLPNIAFGRVSRLIFLGLVAISVSLPCPARCPSCRPETTGVCFGCVCIILCDL